MMLKIRRMSILQFKHRDIEQENNGAVIPSE